MDTFTVDKDQHGTIWITYPDPYRVDRNRVAYIERDDKGDVWYMHFSKDVSSFWFTLVISEENTEEKMVAIAKSVMMFSQMGVEFQ